MKGQNKARTTAPVTVHALLTTLALLGVYLTWTRDRAQVQSEWVVALDLGKRDISSLVYADENRTVNMERRTNADGDPYAWLTVQTRSKQVLPNPASTPTPASVSAQPPNPQNGPAATPAAKPGVPATPPAAKPAAPGAPAAAKPATPPAKGGDKAGVDKNASQPGSVPVPPAVHPMAPAAPRPTAAKPDAPSAAVLSTAAPAVAPAAAPPAPPPPSEVKETITVKEFRGGDQADKLFDLFAPMRVVRSLGTVDDKKAKELGLDQSKKSLSITAKGQTIKFVLGSNSYGSGDIYARDPHGQVYLLSHRLVSDFEFAESRLMERRLHRFERPDFDRIEVQITTVAGQKTRTLLQKNRQDAANFFFTDAATPDKRDDTLRNWVDKVLRMALNDYVNKGEEPQAAGPVSGAPLTGEVVTVRFFDGKKKLGEAVYSRYPNKAGQNEYYARTETTLGLVRLLTATAESAIQDAEKW